MAPTLAYWDLRGFASPIRLLLHYAEVEFVDKLYKIGPGPEFDKSDWLKEKFELGLDYPNLPYYIDGDLKLTQSSAILRHLGRKHKLTGETEEELLRVEMTELQVIDVRSALVTLCYKTPEAEFESAKETYLKDVAGPALGLFAKFLGEHQFVAGGDKLTYADFMLYELLDFHLLLSPSVLDATPGLKDYVARIEALPSVDKHLKSASYARLPIWGPMAIFGGQKVTSEEKVSE